MSSITKRIVDASSLVYQAVLHVFLRDFTNYYWHKELQQQSQRFTESLNIQTNDEVLDREPTETEVNNSDTSESIDFNSNIEENQINKECSHETGDKSGNYENFHTPSRSIKDECTIENLGDCVQKDELGNNSSKDPFCCVTNNVGSDLSSLPDELKGTSLKQNLSYVVIASKSDGDSLTSKILNNENYLGDLTFANPANTSEGVVEEQNSLQENLIEEVENEYENLNDLTICFEDVSLEPSKIDIDHSPHVSEPLLVDEGLNELPQKCKTPELSHSIIQDQTHNDQLESVIASRTKSTESLIIETDTVEPKSHEENCPMEDSVWSIDIVQEKIQNLLSALTSNIIENSADETVEPAQKISVTYYDDSDNVSEDESYDELVKKVFSDTKSEGEICQIEERSCTCTTEPSCLHVVEFDEADELLTVGQMSSIDTGSVSDWLYSVTPAICLPSVDVSTIETSEDPMRVHEKNTLSSGKNSKYQEEIISRTLFTHKWVGDTKKYCRPTS